MDLIFSVHTMNGADGPGFSSISPESSTRAIIRGLLKRERQQARKRPGVVIIGDHRTECSVELTVVMLCESGETVLVHDSGVQQQ